MQPDSPDPQATTPTSRASKRDFVFYHSENDDKPIGYRSPSKKRALDGQDAKKSSGIFLLRHMCLLLIPISC